MPSTARFYIWPRYALEIDGKRITFPPIAGAVISRLFQSLGHFVDGAEIIEAAYFDDPEGGPATADWAVRGAIHRAKPVLATLGASIDGWAKTGRYRLRMFDTPSGFKCLRNNLPRTGNHGPYRYLSTQDNQSRLAH